MENKGARFHTITGDDWARNIPLARERRAKTDERMRLFKSVWIAYQPHLSMKQWLDIPYDRD